MLATDEAVIVFPDTAIVTGLLMMDVCVAGTEIQNRRQFADVWIRRPDGWRLGLYFGAMSETTSKEIQNEIQAGITRALAEKGIS